MKAIEKKIAQHSDTVQSFFAKREDIQPLLEKLAQIERISGHQEGRKDTVPWHGYKYSFREDPKKIYWTRFGHTWCHEFRDCGVNGDERAPDLDPAPWKLWEDNDNDDDKAFEQILKMPPHLAVAYALWFTEGW